jgi:hypothetical protein
MCILFFENLSRKYLMSSVFDPKQYWDEWPTEKSSCFLGAYDWGQNAHRRLVLVCGHVLAHKNGFFLSFWLVRWPRLVPFDEMGFYCLERKLGKTVSFGRWKGWDKCNLLKGERRYIVLNWVGPTNREHRRSSCSLTRPAHTQAYMYISWKKSICIFPPRTKTEFTTDQEQYTMRTIFGQFHTSMHGRRQGPELHSLQLVSTDDGF